MSQICNKDLLALNIKRMKKDFIEYFNFIPKTWVLPQENGELKNFASKN